MSQKAGSKLEVSKQVHGGKEEEELRGIIRKPRGSRKGFFSSVSKRKRGRRKERKIMYVCIYVCMYLLYFL